MIRRASLALLVVLSCGPGRLARVGEPEVHPGSWSFVILPDTQKYAARHPDIFRAQTDWIAHHADVFDIRFALHVGDIVDRNRDVQWRRASKSLHALDGKVPYVLAPGNHDYESDAKTRASRLSEFFPPRSLDAGFVDGGEFEPARSENSFRVVETPSGRWLLLALEFGPRDAVLDWANRVLAEHRDTPAIISTHAYLYADGTRYNWERTHRQQASPHHYGVANEKNGGVNDGEEMWNKLVSKNENVVFVFSGHVLGDGAGQLTSRGSAGHRVHQVVANYQMKRRGGSGYLRLVQVDPAALAVRISTYSPTLNATRYDSQHEFTLDLRGTMLAPRP